jgi:hypothetical protein
LVNATLFSSAARIEWSVFGVPGSELNRVARLISKPKTLVTSKPQVQKSNQSRKPSLSEKLLELSGQSPQDFKDAMIPKGMNHFSFFSDAGLQAIIPAANGVFTADSLAKVYAMLANKGQWNGEQLIRPEIFKQLGKVQFTARDRVMPIPMHWRLGYHRILTMGNVRHMVLVMLVLMARVLGVILIAESVLPIRIILMSHLRQAIIVYGV